MPNLRTPVELTIRLGQDDFDALDRVIGDGRGTWASVNELVEYLARSAADGVRRPGSWERRWLTSATGWADA